MPLFRPRRTRQMLQIDGLYGNVNLLNFVRAMPKKGNKRFPCHWSNGTMYVFATN